MRADELVRRAMNRLGVDGPTALADAIGLPGRQAPRRISRWLAGENEPDYEATLLLLDAAGMLHAEATPRADGDGSGGDVGYGEGEALSAFLKVLDQAAASQEAAIAAQAENRQQLEALIRRLERRLGQ